MSSQLDITYISVAFYNAMFDGDKKENEEEANTNVWYIIYNIHVKMLAIYQTYWVIGESKKTKKILEWQILSTLNKY